MSENWRDPVSSYLRPIDSITETDLSSCSLAARALWFEVFCLMLHGRPYGHLALADRPPSKFTLTITAANLAWAAGSTESEVVRLLTELENAGVISRTPEGVIYSPQMVHSNSPTHQMWKSLNESPLEAIALQNQITQ